jgi:hypothetical protein
MTREARLMCGIILITVPTIQYGGYFLLTQLMNKSSGYMDNPLRQNFFRAGHAHAGVIVILSLICQLLADNAGLSGSLIWLADWSAAGRDSDPARVFPLGIFADRDAAQRSNLACLRWRHGPRRLGTDLGNRIIEVGGGRVMTASEAGAGAPLKRLFA